MSVRKPNYKNSRPLDVHNNCAHAGLNEIVEVVHTDLKVSLGVGVGRYEKQYKRHLRIVIMDLLRLDGESFDYVAYSRNKNSYAKGTRYRKLRVGYTFLIGVVDALEKLCYIENKKGFYSRKKKNGFQSRMCAALKLLKAHESMGEIIQSINEKRLQTLVILKNTEKEEISFKRTREVVRKETLLRRVNSLLHSVNIDLHLPEGLEEELAEQNVFIHRDRISLRRVFNDCSFQKGGRFYGNFVQTLPKEVRKYLMINGEPCCELDYSGLHVNMLYDEIGEKYEGKDVYNVGQKPVYDKKIIYIRANEMRALIKNILLILINCDSENKTVKAVMEKVRENNRKIVQHIESRYGIKVDASFIRNVIKRFSERHEKISKYFSTGIGIKLQYIDSCITELILADMTSQGIACIPIHDSYIVQACYRFKLYDAMLAAYYQRYKKYPKIELKWPEEMTSMMMNSSGKGWQDVSPAETLIETGRYYKKSVKNACGNAIKTYKLRVG